MNDPVIEFASHEQLNKCLAEWQERLFLSDWIIKASLCEPHEMSDGDRYGECAAGYTKKDASILIMDRRFFPDNAIERYCAEQVLVHELLHCKYVGYEKQCPTIEECFFDVSQHALLEQMAKSLIMAKYNLPYSWFRNF